MPAGFRCFAVIAGDVAGRILTDDPIRPNLGRGSGRRLRNGVSRRRACGIHLAPADRQAARRWRCLSWPVARRRAHPATPVGPRLRWLYAGFHRSPDRRGAGCVFAADPRWLHICATWIGSYSSAAQDRDFYCALYGSAEQALEKVYARFLMRGDEIRSEESYAYFAALGMIEIATSTREPYRGRGYATITCAHLIQACEAHGYQTYWNCAKQNLASAAVARKLGYRTEKEYRLLAWFKRNQ